MLDQVKAVYSYFRTFKSSKAIGEGKVLDGFGDKDMVRV